ncbi:hypothetical protein BGW38_007398, partial [Lunasporangiospora selenospora]
MHPKTQQTFHDYHQLCTSYFEALGKGQLIQTERISDSMDKHFTSLQTEMDKNRTLQDQLFEMQQRLQQQMQTNQQQLVQLQQQALDRLAIIQNRTQAILTQTYELHEYPIPRLFIVLPKLTRRRDMVFNLFTTPFRLYFLCECGEHTMSESTNIPHKIHMAKHEGYDVGKPKEFFEKYGSYILAMMQMVKFVIGVAGIVVPPLALSDVQDGIETLQRNLDVSRDRIGDLVDQTINLLTDQLDGGNESNDGSTGAVDLEKLEVLEGADLRQLESYLKVKDEGRVLGNLYRIVTTVGHVKWVCIDHYRENYRLTAVQQLRDVVEENEGTFIEETGHVNISLRSSTLAKQFYDALVKARGVQVLEITLQWNATMDDLRAFAAAVTAANVIHLTVDGQYFDGPALDYINRKRRFDPIARLLSNGRIQSITLDGLGDFFKRVTDSSISIASQLRVLDFGWERYTRGNAFHSGLTTVLKHCHSLVELRLYSYNLSSDFAFIAKNTRHLDNPALVILHDEYSSLTIDVLRGQIQAVSMSIYTYNALDHHSTTPFFQGGHLTGLSIDMILPQDGYGPLANIMDWNPKLTEIRAVSKLDLSLHIINLIMSTRQDILSEGHMSGLYKFELVDTSQRRSTCACIVNFGETVDSIDLTTNISMRDTVAEETRVVLSGLFRQYGWSIESLETDDDFDHVLAEQLEIGTRERGSKLKSLQLHTNRLSLEGIKTMDKVIGRSDCLQEFTTYLHLNGPPHLHSLSPSNRSKLTGLLIHAGADGLSVSQYPRISLARCDVPLLNTFIVWCDTGFSVSSDFARWIAAMVSPTETATLTSPAQPSIVSTRNTQRAWMPLRRIILEGMDLESEYWNIIIGAVDFVSLEELSFAWSNFSWAEIIALIVRMESISESTLPLKRLDLTASTLCSAINPDDTRELLVRLSK